MLLRARQATRAFRKLSETQPLESGRRAGVQCVQVSIRQPEADPVVVPSVVEGHGSRSQLLQVVPKLLQPLIGRPSRHAQLRESHACIGLVAHDAFSQEFWVQPELGAGIAEEEHVDSRFLDLGERAIVSTWDEEHVRVGDECLREGDGVGPPELDALGSEVEGEARDSERHLGQGERYRDRGREENRGPKAGRRPERPCVLA